MGAFHISITGVGGHGCERKAKAGEKLYGRCGRFTCPDCLAYEFTQRLQQAGMVRAGDIACAQEVVPGAIVPDGAEIYHVDADGRIVAEPVDGGKTYWQIRHSAEFTHWPYQPSSVVDDMLKNERRSGQF
jgi:hypothetical protein